jgi:hypothetical protein
MAQMDKPRRGCSGIHFFIFVFASERNQVGRQRCDFYIIIADCAPMPRPQALSMMLLLVLFDDVGFGQFSVPGGGVPAPSMQKPANEGLFYNRFQTAALCSPTRSTLLTGRNHCAGTAQCVVVLPDPCCGMAVLPKWDVRYWPITTFRWAG